MGDSLARVGIARHDPIGHHFVFNPVSLLILLVGQLQRGFAQSSVRRFTGAGHDGVIDKRIIRSVGRFDGIDDWCHHGLADEGGGVPRTAGCPGGIDSRCAVRRGKRRIGGTFSC